MEKFSLDYYRVFCCVFEARSFSEAARRLFITQSAVSQSVKQLEVLLGVRLFMRGKRSVTPTEEAIALFSGIAPALDTIGSAEEKMERMRTLREGSLRVAAADTVSRKYLLPYLKRWHETYPGVRLEVFNRTSTEAFSLLSSGAIDVAFVNSPVDREKFAVTKCMALHDVFIAGARFSALKDRTVPLEELFTYPLIMLEKRSNSRLAFDAFTEREKIACRPEIELGSHDLLVDFASIGLGVSLVTREFTDLSGGLFEVKTDRALPERELDLCYLETGPSSEAKQRFIALFRA